MSNETDWLELVTSIGTMIGGLGACAAAIIALCAMKTANADRALEKKAAEAARKLAAKNNTYRLLAETETTFKLCEAEAAGRLEEAQSRITRGMDATTIEKAKRGIDLVIKGLRDKVEADRIRLNALPEDADHDWVREEHMANGWLMGARHNQSLISMRLGRLERQLGVA